MGFGILILGLVVFLGSHIFVTFRETRARADRAAWHTAIARCSRWSSIIGLALIV